MFSKPSRLTRKYHSNIQIIPSHRFYNFFSRSKWLLVAVVHLVAVLVVTKLGIRLGRLYLLVDDTLLHKRGKHVYGLGGFVMRLPRPRNGL